MKEKTTYFKSLRFRILVILVFIGLIPSFIVEHGILNSYEERTVSIRTSGVKTQCDILVNQLITEQYLQNPTDEGINSELAMLSNVYSGRILIVDQDFKVIKDTYDMDRGKRMISKEILQCFRSGEEKISYDRKNSYIEMILPIRTELEAEGDIQGVLLISISTQEVVSNVEALQQKGTEVMIMVVIFVLVFGYILSSVLMRPFAKITKAIEDITDGFQDEQIHVPDYTETELITNAFNKMFARVKALDNSRQEFVSNVSHELKTPLTSMKVLADSLVRQENVPIELYQEFMQDIADEIDRENKIITDLLTLVRLDKKAESLNIDVVNINELVDLIIKRLTPIADKRGITLSVDEFRPIIAEVDETKLTLALTNLIENGIKYNRDSGYVNVALNADNKYFYITVSDSGIGIPEESLDHVFERFYRVDKSHSTEIEGTGLGLAITKSTILMHHGAIRVKSVEGEGTTFSVRIPLNHVN